MTIFLFVIFLYITFILWYFYHSLWLLIILLFYAILYFVVFLATFSYIRCISLIFLLLLLCCEWLLYYLCFIFFSFLLLFYCNTLSRLRYWVHLLIAQLKITIIKFSNIQLEYDWSDIYITYVLPFFVWSLDPNVIEIWVKITFPWILTKDPHFIKITSESELYWCCHKNAYEFGHCLHIDSPILDLYIPINVEQESCFYKITVWKLF